MEAGQPLFNPPPGITLHYFLPNLDASKAVCLWEADSLESVKNLVDTTLGSTTKNEFFEVDTKNAWGLREATMAFGLAYERAVLAWFDALPAEIAGQAEPGG